MRTSKIISALIILTIGYVSAALAQQQFTQTVTTQNMACNSGCSLIDVPGLNDNPDAIILATQIAGVHHPIGAYWRAYEKKWSIFNLDGISIVPGAKFQVEYFSNPGPNQFIYNAPYAASPCIDHASLNNNPSAQVRIFPTQSPTLGALFNRNEVKVEYDTAARKWCVGNILPNLVFPGGTAYNIVISPLTALPAINTATFVPPPTPTPQTALPGPTSLPPATLDTAGKAGGDLNGNYPNPQVIGLQGKAISITAPTFGQVLKWNGTAWEPAAENVATTAAPSATAKSSVLYFNQSNMVEINNPNLETLPIAGLDNQVFPLTQSSRVVHYTTIAVENANQNILVHDPVQVWVVVDILNSSDIMVSRAVAEATVNEFEIVTIVAVGIGILPAGTFHTRVSLNRKKNGPRTDALIGSYRGPDVPTQGGQMIIEIFPD
jgi:hypothetical protein